MSKKDIAFKKLQEQSVLTHLDAELLNRFRKRLTK